MSSKIEAVGHFVPKNKLSNDYFVNELGLDTSNEWIVERTGIKHRHFIDKESSSSDIGFLAAMNCINKTAISANDIDLILVATSTPDHLAFPSTACLIQEKLGCQHTPAFDISAACSGFCFALSTAESFLLNPSYNTILIVGVDCLSTATNMSDRSTCILFADGAGAILLTKTTPEKNNILYSKMYSDGSLNNILSIRRFKASLFYSHNKRRMHFIK